MFNESVRRDAMLLFCSFLFYFGFLVMNASTFSNATKENRTYNDFENPPELCTPRYENRIYQDEFGHSTIRCVKIGIPTIEIYQKPCEDLGLKNIDNVSCSND